MVDLCGEGDEQGAEVQKSGEGAGGVARRETYSTLGVDVLETGTKQKEYQEGSMLGS